MLHSSVLSFFCLGYFIRSYVPNLTMSSKLELGPVNLIDILLESEDKISKS